MRYELGQEIFNNVVSATSKGSVQPAHTSSLIKALARRLNIFESAQVNAILLENHISVRKAAKIRNRYNQVPHLTQDITWEYNITQ